MCISACSHFFAGLPGGSACSEESNSALGPGTSSSWNSWKDTKAHVRNQQASNLRVADEATGGQLFETWSGLSLSPFEVVHGMGLERQTGQTEEERSD